MSTSCFRVAEHEGQRRILARQAIRQGELIVEIQGKVSLQPMRYTVQVGESEHLESTAAEDPAKQASHYDWRYLNHHCAPNAHFQGRSLIALKDIPVGVEITFNYNATEQQMASPFVCWCDHLDCPEGHTVSGFAALGPAEQEALLDTCQEHIRAAYALGRA